MKDDEEHFHELLWHAKFKIHGGVSLDTSNLSNPFGES